MSSSKYVKDVVSNAEQYLSANYCGRSLLKRVAILWLTNYSAELDSSPKLSAEQANYYQSQIGVLHLIMELSHVDIQTEDSMLASQMGLPCQGHLDAVFRVFSYLKSKHNLRLALNLCYPEIDYNVFLDHDWSSMYRDVKEAIVPDAPTTHGKEVDICLYVDSDHASDKFTCHSCTGFFIFLNSTLIIWKLKK